MDERERVLRDLCSEMTRFGERRLRMVRFLCDSPELDGFFTGDLVFHCQGSEKVKARTQPAAREVYLDPLR
ncbi:MAG: hypothetical protein GEU71_03590 [Actinobacteria bacterium]|nr:hypothetical protein [Actinomycetota bacterium]